MSCRTLWSGPQPDADLEALLQASLDRAERKKWTVGFPVTNLTLGEGKPGGGNAAAAVSVPSAAVPPVAGVLSPSQVNGYLDCSARWKYKYIDKLPAPPSGKQVRGSAVHSLVSYWFRQRMSGHTPDAVTLAEAYNEIWDTESEGAVFGAKESIAELHQSGAELAELYLREAGEKITPAATELRVSGRIGGVQVQGYVDLLCQDQSGKIIDLKTTGRTPSSVSAGHALQLATYAALTPGASGLVQLDTLVATKTPKLVQIEYQIPEADIRLTERLYPAVQESMRRGFYLPNRGSMFCSRANCAYADVCTAEFGGLVE